MVSPKNIKFPLYDSYSGPKNPEILNKPVKIVQKAYNCGCWGRMHEPQIVGDALEIEAGVGYKSNKHFHAQNFAVLDADDKAVLLQVRKNADGFYPTVRHYIAGRDDGQLFLTQVPRTVETLAEAYAFLQPKAATKPGTLRQGDIYFIPVKRKIANFRSGEIRGSHTGSIAQVGKVTYATGTITHPQHGSLELQGVYKVAYAKTASRQRGHRGD